MIPKHILDELEMRYLHDEPIPSRVNYKPKPRVCSDCDLVVTDRLVDISLVNRGKHTAWKHKCSVCKQCSMDGTEWITPEEFERRMRTQR